MVDIVGHILIGLVGMFVFFELSSWVWPEYPVTLGLAFVAVVALTIEATQLEAYYNLYKTLVGYPWWDMIADLGLTVLGVFLFFAMNIIRMWL